MLVERENGRTEEWDDSGAVTQDNVGEEGYGDLTVVMYFDLEEVAPAELEELAPEGLEENELSQD